MAADQGRAGVVSPRTGEVGHFPVRVWETFSRRQKIGRGVLVSLSGPLMTQLESLGISFFLRRPVAEFCLRIEGTCFFVFHG